MRLFISAQQNRNNESIFLFLSLFLRYIDDEKKKQTRTPDEVYP